MTHFVRKYRTNRVAVTLILAVGWLSAIGVSGLVGYALAACYYRMGAA